MISTDSIIRELNAFHIENPELLNAPMEKQRITPKTGYLIIGLGGHGADMLLETKRLIDQKCYADDDTGGASGRVGYLVFDSDHYTKRKCTGVEYGRGGLDENDVTLFCNGLIPPLKIKDCPWIASWLDQRIIDKYHFIDNYHGDGAGGIRQVGRLLMFIDMGQVLIKIRSAIEILLAGEGIESLCIYILTGLSGGTGGGTFLDIAYIVREVAREIFTSRGLNQQRIKVCGYLSLPEVRILENDLRIRNYLMRNTGASLQELEQAMKLREIRGRYECKYSDSVTICSNRAPFDIVNLINPDSSAVDAQGWIYRGSPANVAGSILRDVSCADVMQSDYVWQHALQLQKNAAQPTHDGQVRWFNSIGYASWGIPADYYTKCVFSVVFRRFDHLMDRSPDNEDLDNIFMELGLKVEDRVASMMRLFHTPFAAGQFKPRDLFGKNRLDLNTLLPFDQEMNTSQTIMEDDLKKFRADFTEMVWGIFRDQERGPIWLSDLFELRQANGTSLQRQIWDELNRARELNRDLALRIGQIRKEIEEIDHISTQKIPSVFVLSKKRCEHYIGLWNILYKLMLERYCLELLTGDAGRGKGFYNQVMDIVRAIDDRWARGNRFFLEAANDFAHKNIQYFENDEMRDRHYLLPGGKDIVSGLYSVINDEFVNSGLSEHITDAFLNDLLGTEDEMWSHASSDKETFNAKEFIVKFLERNAGNLFNISMDRIAAACYGEDQELIDSVNHVVLEELFREAEPGFDGVENDFCETMISTPSKFTDKDESDLNWDSYRRCSNIEKGTAVYCRGHMNAFKVLSSLNDRISVVRRKAGIAISDYYLYERCERAIAQMPDAVGLFREKKK